MHRPHGILTALFVLLAGCSGGGGGGGGPLPFSNRDGSVANAGAGGGGARDLALAPDLAAATAGSVPDLAVPPPTGPCATAGVVSYCDGTVKMICGPNGQASPIDDCAKYAAQYNNDPRYGCVEYTDATGHGQSQCGFPCPCSPVAPSYYCCDGEVQWTCVDRYAASAGYDCGATGLHCVDGASGCQ
jgi:hypothetical protein